MDGWTMKASQQWSTRPADERFLSLTEMQAKLSYQRDHSAGRVVETKIMEAVPTSAKDLVIAGPTGNQFAPTHWSFGQLASLGKAPAGYLRNLPAPLAADCINYGLKFKRDQDEVGLLLFENGERVLRAATGPNYGRIWNNDIVGKLVERFGDGVEGHWRVPGEFGKRVGVTRENTTLYASDRDMFVFLADEDRRIEIPNRRDGQSGSLARGFYMWNSEVGDTTFGIGTFLFDYACCNRIVWGGQDYKELKVRHTISAPTKFLEEVTPALESYAKSSTGNIVAAIEDARAHKLGDDLEDFLKNRFGAGMVASLKKVHELEENRPIETRWDVIVAATAAARGREHQDSRVQLERDAGKLLTA